MRLVLVQPTLSHLPDGDNMATLRSALDSVRAGTGDIVLLPERCYLGTERQAYERAMTSLAKELSCTLVAGSQHWLEGSSRVHRGIVVQPDGSVLGEFHKLRPYSDERNWVDPGTIRGEFEIDGRRVLVLICADFWFSDLLLATRTQPDLILVPALSVSRKHAPAYSKALWQHLAVTRAYELGAFVGVSDWAHDSTLPVLKASGVSGFADPTQEHADALFAPLDSAVARAFDLDFAALERFRDDRRGRGFFWIADGS